MTEDIGLSSNAINDQDDTGEVSAEASSKKKKPQDKSLVVNRLLTIIKERAHVFRTEGGELYADIEINFLDPDNTYAQTVPLTSDSSGDFVLWLTSIYHVAYGIVPGDSDVSKAVRLTMSNARFSPDYRDVYIRIAPDGDGGIYIDSGNSRHEIYHVTPQGWTIERSVPVSFVRPGGMMAYPEPRPGTGNLKLLKRHVNTKHDDDFMMMLSYIIGCFNPHGPYPCLAVYGQGGSAKTMMTKIVRMFTDPHTAKSHRLPKNVEQMVLHTNGSWVIAYENLTFLNDEMQSFLCLCATGAAELQRQLYTNRGLNLHVFNNPTIINAIGDVVTRGDLLSRLIAITLQHIPEDERLLEAQVFARLEEDASAIFTGILDALVFAVKNFNPLQRPEGELPRMADFASWVMAAEEGLPWEKGTFIGKFMENKKRDSAVAAESSPILTAFLAFAEVVTDNDKNECRYSPPQAFYEALKEEAAKGYTEPRDQQRFLSKFPSTAARLTTYLNNQANIVRDMGYEYSTGQSGGVRFAFIRRIKAVKKDVTAQPVKDVL